MHSMCSRGLRPDRHLHPIQDVLQTVDTHPFLFTMRPKHTRKLQDNLAHTRCKSSQPQCRCPIKPSSHLSLLALESIDSPPYSPHPLLHLILDYPTPYSGIGENIPIPIPPPKPTPLRQGDFHRGDRHCRVFPLRCFVCACGWGSSERSDGPSLRYLCGGHVRWVGGMPL